LVADECFHHLKGFGKRGFLEGEQLVNEDVHAAPHKDLMS